MQFKNMSSACNSNLFARSPRARASDVYHAFGNIKLRFRQSFIYKVSNYSVPYPANVVPKPQNPWIGCHEACIRSLEIAGSSRPRQKNGSPSSIPISTQQWIDRGGANASIIDPQNRNIDAVHGHMHPKMEAHELRNFPFFPIYWVVPADPGHEEVDLERWRLNWKRIWARISKETDMWMFEICTELGQNTAIELGNTRCVQTSSLDNRSGKTSKILRHI